MAEARLKPLPISSRPSDHSEHSDRVWRWVFLSGLAHVGVVAALLITPFMPGKAPIYPVYTVDLVGGEKLGGGAGTAIEPVPKAKPVPEVKETKPNVPDKRAEMTEKLAKAKAKKEAEAEKFALAKTKKETEAAEKLALAKAKQEAEMTERLALAKAKKEEEERQRLAEEAEAEKVRENLKALRQKRAEDAVTEVKNRVALEEKQKQQELQRQQQLQQQQQRLQQLQQAAQKAATATSTLPGKEPGAAGFTAGATGTGGGIVKGPEYVRYYNEMRARIKSSWTWPGRRTDVRVTVSFSVQDNGEINGLRIIRSSGDRSYDESVIRAVRKATPFPPLPVNIKEELRNWEWDFAPKDLAS